MENLKKIFIQKYKKEFILLDYIELLINKYLIDINNKFIIMHSLSNKWNKNQNLFEFKVEKSHTKEAYEESIYNIYELNNNSFSYDSLSVLGIIEYTYDEARKYFEELDKTNTYNKNFVPHEETREFGVKVPEIKKTNIDIGDL